MAELGPRGEWTGLRRPVGQDQASSLHSGSCRMIMGKASLTYYIFEGLLVGRANGRHFHIFALSGGRAGSTIEGVVDRLVANNPYQTPRRHPESPSGGPLPRGT